MFPCIICIQSLLNITTFANVLKLQYVTSSIYIYIYRQNDLIFINVSIYRPLYHYSKIFVMKVSDAIAFQSLKRAKKGGKI